MLYFDGHVESKTRDDIWYWWNWNPVDQ